MTTLYDDQLFPGESATSGSITQSPSSDSGIGMAPPAAPAGPSTSQRIFRAMEAFGSGMSGNPDPNIRWKEEARKKKLTDLEELKGTVSALEHGITMRQGMSGDDATAFDEAYGNKLEAIQPGMKQTFLALTKKPDLLTQFQGYAQNLPEPLQIMMKSNPKEFLKFAGTAEGMKVLTEAKDKKDIALASKKVQTTMMGLQQYVPADKLKGIMADQVITASEILDIQQHLPDAMKLSDTEIGAIQRNDKVFWQGLGVLHGDQEQQMLRDRAKNAGKAGEVKEPKTEHINGKVYQWDPDNKVDGKRLTTDGRYVELGAQKEPGSGGLNRDTVATELKISDDWRQDTKKFSERRPMFESTTDYMANRGTNKTSAGDAALAFAYAKMRDPNDRLAVAETRDLVKLGNIFERIGVNITGVLDKGETIPDRVAKQMYDEIRRNFTEQNRAQTNLEKQYKEKIKAYGGESSRVMGQGLAIPEDQLKPKGKSKEAGKKMNVGDVVERGGKRWRVTGHDTDGEPIVEEVRGRST